MPDDQLTPAEPSQAAPTPPGVVIGEDSAANPTLADAPTDSGASAAVTAAPLASDAGATHQLSPEPAQPASLARPREVTSSRPFAVVELYRQPNGALVTNLVKDDVNLPQIVSLNAKETVRIITEFLAVAVAG